MSMKRAVGTAGWIALAVLCIAGVRANAPAAMQASAVGSSADSAYQAKDWSTAAGLYRKLVTLQPESFTGWMRLGVSLHGLGRNQEALQALEKAGAVGAPASSVQYQVAIVRASTGDRSKALDALAEAVAQGRGRPDLMLAQIEFQPLRGDARFAELLAGARKNDAPCRYREENRQFDFWLGDWDVITTQDHTPAGSSHIQNTIGDCVIWENWTSLGDSGYTGKSYNVYNTEQKRWEQFWVDNRGGMIHFYGNLSAGVMDFHTDDIPQADGKNLRRHLRFFNVSKDQVRQLSEGSTDNGSTWTVEYDFTYTRSAAAPGPSGS